MRSGLVSEYEIVNEETGEIEVFKTSIDIQQLEDYNQWKIEQMLNPPSYSPKEYAEHVESEKAKLILSKVKDYISLVDDGKLDPILVRIKEMVNG
jgi:hypothetical protein